MDGEPDRAAEGQEAVPRGNSWGANIAVPLIAASLGALIVMVGSVYIANRQMAESRRQVDHQMAESRREVAGQISADRAGRLSDVRAATYGEFVSAVDRHLGIIGEPSETSIRQADENVFAALRLVQLRGSLAAYVEAQAIAGRTRNLTNGAIEAIQGHQATQVRAGPFFAQPQALNGFVHDVQPELRR